MIRNNSRTVLVYSNNFYLFYRMCNNSSGINRGSNMKVIGK
jgi:hypothetical protein